jgi:hemolysin III
MKQPTSIYSRPEKLADSAVHVLGMVASVAAVATLAILAVVHSLPAQSAVSLGVYGAGLTAVFSCSAAYHLTREGKAKALLGRLDHAAIFVKIAATYTPFALVKLGGSTGHLLLSVVWSISALGAAAKLFLPGRMVIMGYMLYLSLGWAIVTVWEPFSAAVSTRVMTLLAIGGILYSGGVIFHLCKRLRFHTAIWHGMVLAASACHFAAIVDCIALGRSA